MTDLWHALEQAFAQEVARIARPAVPEPVSPAAAGSEQPRTGTPALPPATFPAPRP